ncbi:MAG: hypothetical protein ABFQ95_05110 [Pseudomonadota bacterium]
MKALRILSIVVLLICNSAASVFATEEQPETDKERLQKACLNSVKGRNRERAEQFFAGSDYDIEDLDITYLIVDCDVPFLGIAEGLRGNTTTKYFTFYLGVAIAAVEEKMEDLYSTLLSLEHLETITLNESIIDSKYVDPLINFIENSNIKTLNLECAFLGGIKSFLNKLQLNKSLTSLNLARNTLDDEDCGLLSTYLTQNPGSLTNLNLSDNSVKNKGILSLSAMLGKLSNLKLLDLSDNHFDNLKDLDQYNERIVLVKHSDEAAKESYTFDTYEQSQIFCLHNVDDLEELKFVKKGKIPTQKILRACFFPKLKKKNSQIKFLTMSRYNLGNSTYKLLETINNYQFLEKLYLSKNGINSNTLKKIIHPLSTMGNLKDLDLGNNKIAYDGFELLFEKFKLKLSFLRLAKNNINLQKVVDKLKKTEHTLIEILELCEQSNQEELSDEFYEKATLILEEKFKNSQFILDPKDALLFSEESELPVKNLISVSEEQQHSNEIRSALPFRNSPSKKYVDKSKWNLGSVKMSIDPSGAGSDPVGYAVIKSNSAGEVFVKAAGSIKGDGLSDEIFDQLLDIAEREKVKEVLVEFNYNQGGYLVALREYYRFRKLKESIQINMGNLKIENELNGTEDYTTEESSESDDDLKYAHSQPKSFVNTNVSPQQNVTAQTILDHSQKLFSESFEFVSIKTTGKDKGIRIVNTLKPLLEEGKLFVDEEFLKKDFENRDKQNSLLREMSWIAPGFKSDNYPHGKHDDIVDALEMAITYAHKELKSVKRKIGVDNANASGQ